MNSLAPVADRIRALVAGMNPRARAGRCFLMLQAFFDDSGTGLDSPAFVFAGYAADHAKWESFSIEWDRVLKRPHRLKPNGLAYFKASEAMARQGEFWGWTEDERDDRLRDLFALIPPHALTGCFSVIPVHAYKRVFTGRFTHSTFDHPYLVMLYSVFPILMKRLDTVGIFESVKFIFDSSEGHEAKIHSTWETFVETIPEQYKDRIVRTVGFESEKDFPPLQAADAIAWYIRRQFFENDRGNVDYRNEIYESLFQTEHVYWILNEEKLEEAARAMPNRRIDGTIMSLPDPSNPLNWGV